MDILYNTCNTLSQSSCIVFAATVIFYQLYYKTIKSVTSSYVAKYFEELSFILGTKTLLSTNIIHISTGEVHARFGCLVNRMSRTSLQQCAQTCHYDPQCTSFYFSNQTCFLNGNYSCLSFQDLHKHMIDPSYGIHMFAGMCHVFKFIYPIIMLLIKTLFCNCYFYATSFFML